MRILLSSAAFAAALFLSGCSTLGSLLSTPFKWLDGMADAVGRTVTEAKDPVLPPGGPEGAGELDPLSIAGRGAEIAARGPHSGRNLAAAPLEEAESRSVARR